MKLIKFLIAGVVFGIVMAKSEAVSWYRIQEMFRFDAFHMYGIIGTAVTLGAAGVWIIKKFNLRDISGNPISFLRYTRIFIQGAVLWKLTNTLPGGLMLILPACGTAATTTFLRLGTHATRPTPRSTSNKSG